MFTASAVKKCPASWMRMRNARPPMATRMFTSSVNQLPRERRRSLPRLGVDGDELVEVTRGDRVRRVQGSFDDLGDSEEGQTAVEERGHCDLVRRIEDAWRGPPRLARRPGQGEAR